MLKTVSKSVLKVAPEPADNLHQAIGEDIKEELRYFIRATRKRLSSNTAKEQDNTKRVRAIIIQLLTDNNSNNIDLDKLKDLLGDKFETIFPVEVISRIKIPYTYKEAISNPKYRKIQRIVIAEEMLSLYKNRIF